MDNTILSLDELKSRITSFYQEKKAAHMPPEQDPQETSAPTPVKDDGDDASKLVVPSEALSVQNSDGAAENNIPGTGDKGEASGDAPGVSDTTDVTADKSQQKSDDAVVLAFGNVFGGSTYNVLPDIIKLKGTLRYIKSDKKIYW